MNLAQLLFSCLALSLGIMALLWLLSIVKRDASIVDPYWGIGFVVLAWFSVAMTNQWNLVSAILLLLVSFWGIRLSGYLLIRNRGKGEDRRYTAMRTKHGTRFWWVSLFTVFLLQGAIMWFVAMPIFVGVYFGTDNVLHSPFAIVCIGAGILVWTIGFIFESVGDYQMSCFKANPDNQGKVMDRGLWRFTRHPNYFGDFCIWWGHYLVATAVGAWWTLLSPALMSFFLMKVSGVTLLEGDIEERRPEYSDYKRRTNAFFPWRVRTS